MDTNNILDTITNTLNIAIPLIKEQAFVLPPRVIGRNLPYINFNNYMGSLFLIIFKLFSHFLMFYTDLVLISILCLHPGVAPYYDTILNVSRRIRIFSHIYSTVSLFNLKVENVKNKSPAINNTTAYLMVFLTSALNIYAEYKQTIAIEFLENIFIDKFHNSLSQFPFELSAFVLRLFANITYQYILALFSSKPINLN
uniref:Uncharacterized protein n=1 Tax=viral metagenome TaxID=1070528 RepID=A0A6C0ACU6_9ZZZZ